MPLPEPRGAEDRGQFIERCMIDPDAKNTHPDQAQRFAFCNNRWENAQAAADPEMTEVAKADMPQPLYICRQVVNADDIVQWAKSQGFKTIYPPEKMHVTVCYSKRPVDWFAVPNTMREVRIAAGGPRDLHFLGPDKDVLVLRFKSDILHRRHEQLMELGASFDWPSYQPHITITLQGKDIDIEKVEPYAGELILGVEKFAPVKENWSEDIVEKIDVEASVTKVDTEKRLAYGWFSVVTKGGKPVVDLHGDVISEDQILETAHRYMMSSRRGHIMHEDIHVGDVVESIVFTGDLQKALGINLGKTGWFGAMKIHNEKVWQAVKDKKLRMFSIGGRATRKPL